MSLNKLNEKLNDYFYYTTLSGKIQFWTKEKIFKFFLYFIIILN